MTDYLLAAGMNKAPARNAPAHMAAWLQARGYQLIRRPRVVDPGDPDQVARIASTIDWRSTDREDRARHAIVRQVLAAVSTTEAAGTPTEEVA